MQLEDPLFLMIKVMGLQMLAEVTGLTNDELIIDLLFLILF